MLNKENKPISKILFIPSRPYRSDKAYITIANQLKSLSGVELHYIDFDGYTHDFFKKVDEESRLSYLQTYFYSVKLLDGNPYKLLKTDSRVQQWVKLKRKTIVIVDAIKKLEPQLIVYNFRFGYTINVVKNLFSTIPLVYLQTVAENTQTTRQSKSKTQKIRYSIYQKLGIHLRPKSDFNNKLDLSYHCLWSSSVSINPQNQRAYYVGNPSLDSVLRKYNNNKESNLFKNILFISQPISKVYKENTINKIQSLVKEILLKSSNAGYTVKILVHPREQVEHYKCMFNTERFDIKYSDEFSDKELEGSIAITVSSVMSYELIAKKIPVYAINPDLSLNISTVFPKDYPYIISTNKSIDDEIESWNSSFYYEEFLSNREDFLNKVNMGLNANSSEKIAQQIMNIIEN